MLFRSNGTPSVQAFSPFAPTAAYSASTVGSSGYFDGTGDYLSLADNAAFTLGSGDFTIECWAYTQAWATQYNVMICQWSTGTSFIFRITSALVGLYANISGTQNYTASVTNSLNTWDHFCVTRSGGTLTFYKNGASVGTAAISGTINDVTDNLTVGILGDANSTTAHTGYISGLRLIKGTATAPTITSPPTNVTNTSLLLNFTNAGITDATAKSDLETVGTTQISTSQKKFGTASLYFDGTNNTSRARAIGNLYNLGTTDFTVEFWYYPTSHNSTGYPVLWTNYETWISGASYNNLIGLLAGNKDRTPINAVWLTLGDNYWQGTTTVPSLNTWTHVALVRTGNRYLIFINGTKEVDYTATSTITFNANNMSIVGGGTDSAGLNKITGYIDDFRQTNYARYTANFTPPTQAYALQ